jgi:hypothetical protein
LTGVGSWTVQMLVVVRRPLNAHWVRAGVGC